MIQEKIQQLVKTSLKKLDIDVEEILLEHPTELSHGDYSTNVAMTLAKKEGKNPRELAEEILKHMPESKEIEKVEIAGPGFINFYLSKSFYENALNEILAEADNWGKNDSQKGKKIMVEYTDPNPFKAFHIGHLMSNAIGESISRLIEFSGADVFRATYQGDVGPHVAKAIWGLKHGHGNTESAEGIGEAYAAGASAYEDNQEEIEQINKAVYEEGDKEIGELYEKGREASLKHFEDIYEKLGSKFDHYFFESATWREGVEFVKKHTGTIFTESEGAIIFRGEEHDKKLHTRVFINSKGLPTYEAKELGLPYLKQEKYPFDHSVTITAHEQKTYFEVVIKAIEQFDPKLAKKIQHVSHGFMKLSTGKMSSRTGNVVTGESLLQDVEEKVMTIMENRDIENKKEIAIAIAVAAIKYSILRQASSKDIVYDLEQSLSFEGDSGPYLQYSYTRAKTILEKAEKKGDAGGNKNNTSSLEKLLYRFPEVVSGAQSTLEPHRVTTYLTELAGAFNSFYAQGKIIGGDNEAYDLSLVEAFSHTMKNGLHLLGIKVPDRM